MVRYQKMANVSVIIPVYRKEKYLSECIESILSQTFSDFELICIDDCSPDSCLRILEKFQAVDKRIKIIRNKKNEGAAYSRNVGIRKATGEYVVILDADDVFDKNLLMLTYGKCKEEKLDFVFFDYERYSKSSEKTPVYSAPLPMKERCRAGIFSGSDIEGFSFQICQAGPWLKMYKKDFLIKNNIFFQSVPSSNDVYFSKIAFMKARRIGYLERSLVKYRTNAKFQISNDKKQAALNFMKAAFEIKKVMEKDNLYERNCRSFNSYTLKTALMHFFDANLEDRKEMYGSIKEGFYKLFYQDRIETLFMNQYYFSWMSDFIDIPPERHELYEVDNEYKYIFQNEKSKVERLQKFISIEQCKVALWGYGKNGKSVAKEWQKAKYKLDCIIDIKFASLKREGIMSPDVIEKEKYILLIPSAGLVEDILRRIEKVVYNTKVVDLQSYFAYGFKLEESVWTVGNESVK